MLEGIKENNILPNDGSLIWIPGKSINLYKEEDERNRLVCRLGVQGVRHQMEGLKGLDATKVLFNVFQHFDQEAWIRGWRAVQSHPVSIPTGFT